MSTAAQWQCRDRFLDLGAPVVMGVLNVTPDSFSDGGRYSERDAALRHARRMIEEGAAIVDVGGESTRPGAAAAPLDEELARVIPVIEALRRESTVFISVDTSKPEVMRAACDAGADIINDVRALTAPGALAAAASTRAGICLMHMQGEPRTMQLAPRYDGRGGRNQCVFHRACCRLPRGRHRCRAARHRSGIRFRQARRR